MPYAANQVIIAIPPGATILELLEFHQLNREDFAARMEMDSNDLLNGDIPLTPEIADKLELILGAPAAFWLGLEARYRKKLAAIEEEKICLPLRRLRGEKQNYGSR